MKFNLSAIFSYTAISLIASMAPAFALEKKCTATLVSTKQKSCVQKDKHLQKFETFHEGRYWNDLVVVRAVSWRV
jgi:hypothetical protein